MAKSRRKMLQVRNTAEEVAEPSSRMLNDDEEGPDESIVKLSACFEQIGKQLYRSLDQPQLLKEINILSKSFIESVKTELYPQLFINLAVLCVMTAAIPVKAGPAQNEQMLNTMKRLPATITYTTQKLLYDEFIKTVNALKRVKQTINQEERQLFLMRTRVVSMLAQKYKIELKETDVTSVALSLKQLVDFDSPRFLIQEVQTAA